MADEAALVEALREVVDPELMINVVDLNGSGTPIYIYGTNWRPGT